VELDIETRHFAQLDEDLISRVLINLLTNAIKYSEPNGSIRVTSQEEGEWLSIKVKDEGMGIPEDKLESIFHKYGQIEARKSGAARSTGLGLAFCKMAVEAHGGSINAQRNPTGQGVTFTFTLPKAESQTTISEASTPSGQAAQGWQLSESAKESIKPLLPELESLSVYQCAAIEKTLTQVDTQQDETLKRWVEETIDIAYQGNADSYQSMLEMGG
jgi:anti-sigma regulatory factor (Ser/Thr protein kinase)